jgi:ParB family chromosome partitioning protein
VEKTEVCSSGELSAESNSERYISIDVSSVVVGQRRRQYVGDLNRLMQRMHVLGLLHPIVADSTHKLISGARRLAAIKALGWRTLPLMVADNLNDALLVLQAERDENVQRLDLTIPERIALVDSLMALEKPAAEERHQHSGKHGKEGGAVREKPCG